MELFKEFVSQALIPALALALTGFITWLGVKLKSVFEKSDKEKLYLSLASTCVQAVEQIYKDLDGKAKDDHIDVAVSARHEGPTSEVRGTIKKAEHRIEDQHAL